MERDHESTLRAREHRIRQLEENSRELIAEFSPEGEIVYASENHRAVLGYGPEELEGLSFTELCDLHQVVFEDLPMVDGVPVQAELGTGSRSTQRLVARDGSLLWMEAVVTAYPLDDGRTGVLSISRDVTARREAEAARRESEQRLRAILASLTATKVVVWDTDGTIRTIYGKRDPVYGIRGEELTGQPGDKFVAEQGSEPGFGAVRSVLETGNPVETRQVLSLPAGDFVFDVGLSAVRDENGDIQNVIGVLHDVTERVRAEAAQAEAETQIQQRERLEGLGLLAGGIAHDFNNLLVGILSGAELARRSTEPGSSVYELLRNIETASQHAAELTSQLLAYAGKGRLETRSVDLNAIVGETRKLIDSSTHDWSTPLRVERSGEALWIRADSTQIQRVALNLISNAHEASSGGMSEVVLRTGIADASLGEPPPDFESGTFPDGPHVFLEVEDGGCGMDEATLSHIFDPLYTTKFQGRGLGLAAVMGVIRGHGGGVRVWSRPGRGTRFRVLFPLAQPAEAAQVQSEPSGDYRGHGTVLIVDDSLAVRTVASRTVEEAGFESMMAASGYEAVERFRASKDEIVAVVLDLTMPGMDGADTFRSLRSLRSDLPVLFMSGYSEELIEKLVAGEEAVSILHKPFTIASLISGLRGLLED